MAQRGDPRLSAWWWPQPEEQGQAAVSLLVAAGAAHGRGAPQTPSSPATGRAGACGQDAREKASLQASPPTATCAHHISPHPSPAALSTGCHTRLDGLRIRQLCPGSPGAPSATSASFAPEPPGTDWVTPVEVAPKVPALGAPGVLLVQPQLHRATATHLDGAHPLGTSTRTATSITNADGRSSWHGN